MRRLFQSTCLILCLLGADATVRSDEPARDTRRGDRMLNEYCRLETDRLREACLDDIRSAKDWNDRRETYRRQLFEMLGLDPLPERTPLAAEVTGVAERDEFLVEKLHFQSRPGLYVTGNLYRPKEIVKPLPAILYVCGHGRVKKNGISYGNKTHYQHHGAWFARHGYVCLSIDTLQLGEIEGIHHGTYNHDMWWWAAYGYTPAGVEAWNCIRALDYLESREEVDPARLGVTGRSGGGAYSWWIAALDERIGCAVPVAGITDLENHVVDGCVEGHCDCMYMVNTYRWDYPQVAALVSPRPLLISNTDRDPIFPLDGVVRTYEAVRRIYNLQNAGPNVALNITAGPHQDTQELRVHAFRWLNHHLRGDDGLIDTPAEKLFEPEELKVLDKLPEDERNTKIHESFVKLADEPQPPQAESEWKAMRESWIAALREKAFGGWPEKAPPLDVEKAFAVDRDGIHVAAYDFTSQEAIPLRLYLAQRAGLEKADLVVLNALGEDGWKEKFLAPLKVAFAEELKDEALPPADKEAFAQTQKMFESFPWAMAYVAPRGVGQTAWNPDKRKETQIRRRFHLLGQTLDGMRVWDIRRAVQTLRDLPAMKDVPVWLQAEGAMAGNALYASLFEPDVARLDLYRLPKSHRDGPIYLNVRRILDMPQAVAMAAQESRVIIYQDGDEGWDFVKQTAEQLGWDKKQFRLRKLPE